MANELVKTSKPQLVTVGSREVSTHGWRNSLAIDYILRAVVIDPQTKKARSRWVDVAELARTFYMQNTQTTREKVRRRIPGIASTLLMQNRMLLSETELPHGRCVAVKIMDPESRLDVEMAELKIKIFEKRYNWTAEQRDLACAILAQFHDH